MAEKRRLSARERREPAAKRRASEAAPASSKKKASTPAAPSPAPAPEPEPEVVVNPLPTKIKDGEGLPTLPSPQPETLSDKEYQSIAESAVLLASLERSKKKWLSDGILVRYWTKPKKTKREQIEGKNPPKESMSKVGPCNIVVGPHLFDAMLYTVKDPNAPPPIQYTPPQRPMVHYGHPNNFQQYHPYPSPAPPQHGRQHPPQTPPTNAPSPQPIPQMNNHPPPPPNRTPSQPSPRPPPPQPGPQPAQRPSPSQPPQPAQPTKPSPDPVIQMLATRAASDPDLKALMRVVASSKASQEQLRAFQAHIDELNAIIRAREQQQQRQQQQQQFHQSTPSQSQASPRTPQPVPQRETPHPQSSQRPQSAQQNGQQARPQQPQNPPIQQNQGTPQPQPTHQSPTPSQARNQNYPRVEVQIPATSPSSKSTPGKPVPQTPHSQKPGPTPQVKQEPGTAGQPVNVESSPAVRPMPPPQQSQGAGPRSGPQQPPPQQPYQGHPPAIQSRPPQYGSPAPYYRQAPPPPPPRMNFKSVVFEFTSPLTPYGSSTSGHAGSGDRYLFPEYTILEWLPGGNTVLASFLLVKKVDPNVPFPIETAPDAGSSRAKGKGSRSKKSDKKKAKEKEKEEKEEKEKEENKPDQDKYKNSAQPANSTGQDPSPAEPTAETKQSAAEGDNAAGEKSQQKDQANGTPSQVDSNTQPSKEKTEEAKDTSNLKEYYQPVTFRIHSSNPKVLEPLNRVVKPPDEVRKYMNEVMDRAERAPDGFLAYRLPREDIAEEPEAEEVKKAGTPVPAPPSGRNRPSRGKNAVDESDAENSEFVEELDEEEEELKDFYGPPTGLLPMAPL